MEEMIREPIVRSTFKSIIIVGSATNSILEVNDRLKEPSPVTDTAFH